MAEEAREWSPSKKIFISHFWYFGQFPLNLCKEHGIGKFRIPGRTGASYLKTHQSEAHAGKK